MNALSPRFFAITGVSGSGKSTVTASLRTLGGHTIDADIIAKKVVIQGSSGLTRLVEEFGKGILDQNQDLDRKKLGVHIFQNPQARQKVESILHPLIRQEFDQQLLAFYQDPQNSARIVFYDVPLFFESNYQHPGCLGVIVVAAPKPLCIERIMKRDNITEEQASARIANQIPIDEKITRADFVIMNDGLSPLEPAVKNAFMWATEIFQHKKERL